MHLKWLKTHLELVVMDNNLWNAILRAISTAVDPLSEKYTRDAHPRNMTVGYKLQHRKCRHYGHD